MAEQPQIKVLGFFTKYTRAHPNGVDYARFSPAQALNAQITEERVNALKPKEEDFEDEDGQPNRAAKRTYMQALWSEIGPAYDAWKKGHEIPTSGMPLAAWAGVTKEQADVMRKIGLNTVEELSTLEDGKLTRLPMPNAREVRDLARKYLSTGDDTQMAERMSEVEKANAELREQLAAAMELLEEQTKGKRRPKAEQSEAA